MALTWTLSLKDNVTPGAKSAAGSLDVLGDALSNVRKGAKATGKALEDLKLDKMNRSLNAGVPKLGGFARMVQFMGKSFGPGAAHAMMNVGRGIADWGPALQKVGSVIGPAVAGLASFALSATAVAGALGVAAVGGAAAGLVQIREAQAFRESTMFAFTTILKSKQAGQEAFDLAARTSLDIGADFRTSMSSMNTLLAQGFDVKFADQIIRAMADLQTINPAANLEGITRAISQIKTTGKLQGDELMQLAEAGVNVSDVYKQIAKSMGIVDKAGMTAAEQVQKLQSAGKISSDTAINAIMASIKGQIGGKDFGSLAMAKADGSLEGAIARAMNLKEQLLGAIKIDWSPITNAVKSLMAALSSPAGAKFLETIGTQASRVMKALFGGVDQGGFEKAFTLGGDLIIKFADGLVFAAEQVKRLMDRIDWLDAKLQSISGGLASVGAVGSFVFDTLLAGVSPVLTQISMWSDLVTGIGEQFAGIGTAMIDGIVSGIESGASAVVESITSVASNALAAAKEELGIASPSKEFAKVGRWSAQGMAGGFRAGANVAQGAAQDLAGNALRAGQRVAQAITSTNNDNSRSLSIGSINSGASEDGGRGMVEQLRGMMFSYG